MKEISSKLTYFYKYVLPFIPIFVFVIGSIKVFSAKDIAPIHSTLFFFLFLILLASIILLALVFELRRIWFDGENFLLDDVQDGKKFNISDVEKVTASRWLDYYPVTLYLKSDLGFGKKIKFMPPYKLFALVRGHEIYEELDRKINHR